MMAESWLFKALGPGLKDFLIKSTSTDSALRAGFFTPQFHQDVRIGAVLALGPLCARPHEPTCMRPTWGEMQTAFTT